jgi:NADH:ubiquinone oxidoreductase subunit F (NADH-binding)/Pyruvate/2-oxoacid:ferredoxin oxidoreductase delta subunit
LKQVAEYGLVGDNIFGSNFSFDIELREGAGAFVCGEETALIASIEGKRGMPSPRPPFPAQYGLWGKPTNINNVETWGNVSAILLKGADWFASYGSKTSKGTKTFALAGKIKRTGLIEVPMGIPLKEIIYSIGGGILNDKDFKAVQTGGPSGGCIPASQLDLPVDYESLTQAGSIMGSGGMVVMDENTCMVDIARFFLSFTQSESCGKCVPCRLGTWQMLNILERICNGYGKPEDIALLQDLSAQIKAGSLCGLGQTAPNPVLTTLRYFKDEYEEHIFNHRCPALTCKALISYNILANKCQGCGLCLKNCPSQAISGDKRKVHSIDQSKCSKCGTCIDVCPARFGAVTLVSGQSTTAPAEPVPVGGKG